MPIDAPMMISALAPVLLVLGLGYAAGKHKSFDEDQTRGLSHLALTYALPAALFLSMAHFKRETLIEQAPVALVMLVGYSGLYIILYLLLRGARFTKLRAALLGYTFASSSVPVFGLTVLEPIYGSETGSAVVGLVSLITNFAQVSIAVFLLESAAPQPGERVSFIRSIGRAAANPLVWAPVLGGVLAILGLQLSPLCGRRARPARRCRIGSLDIRLRAGARVASPDLVAARLAGIAGRPGAAAAAVLRRHEAWRIVGADGQRVSGRKRLPNGDHIDPVRAAISDCRGGGCQHHAAHHARHGGVDSAEPGCKHVPLTRGAGVGTVPRLATATHE